MSSSTRAGGRLSVERLECREVPAYVSGGNLHIVGSDAPDVVVVKDVWAHGAARIRVNHNGVVQTFPAARVRGEIVFFGYAGNDSFDYYGKKRVHAEGGAGDDYLGGDRGNDLLIGGPGNDVVEGWAGRDELQGSEGDDLVLGGRGGDLLFGQDGIDQLAGEGGNDEIVGGAGADLAWGGAGIDRFWECQEEVFLPVAVQTQFGLVTVGGVQDFSAYFGDVVYS